MSQRSDESDAYFCGKFEITGFLTIFESLFVVREGFAILFVRVRL
jgi:hypothetical protein